MNKYIILANGKPPSKKVILYLQTMGYHNLVCADGGADTARKMGLYPDYIIGDFDSVKEETLRFFASKSKIIKIKRQNDTDVEKCLKFAGRKKAKEAILLGAIGDRLDHSFCNMGIVIKFFDRIKVRIISDKSILTPYSGDVELSTLPDETISLYGFNDKTKITSNGLKISIKANPASFRTTGKYQ